jgi:hypothetical protein
VADPWAAQCSQNPLRFEVRDIEVGDLFPLRAAILGLEMSKSKKILYFVELKLYFFELKFLVCIFFREIICI